MSCTHPYADNTTDVYWTTDTDGRDTRARKETCDQCGRVRDVMECPPGVHSLFDFCPGRVECQEGYGADD